MNTEDKINLHMEETAERFSISTSHTTYVNIYLHKEIDFKDMNDKVKELRKICKEKKIKFGGNKNVKAILSLELEYQNMLVKYKAKYDEVVVLYKELYKQGLYAPTSNNEFLEKCYKKKWELDPFNYRDSVISKVECMYSRIESLLYDVKHTRKCETLISICL